MIRVCYFRRKITGREIHCMNYAIHTPWGWHKQIFNRAKEKGIMIFSTPFDDSAVDFLDIDVPAYKIASFENRLGIIKKSCENKKTCNYVHWCIYS